MSRKISKRLFCVKCSKKFGDSLAKFSTRFAQKIHFSIVHMRKLKSPLEKENNEVDAISKKGKIQF